MSTKKDAIIDTIKSALKKKSMTQRDLAAALGKSETEVSRWLSGRVGISSPNLQRIASCLEIESWRTASVLTATDAKQGGSSLMPADSSTKNTEDREIRRSEDWNGNHPIAQSSAPQITQSPNLQNPNRQMNYAIILAGGIGSRVGANVPKQFVEILGKPVLAYTIEAYQSHPDIDGIEVVCVKNYEATLREMIERYHLTKVRWICQGGATFQDSVYNGVRNLEGQIDANDVVMVHYGAAPFTTAEIITDAIRVCKEHGSSVSCTPCFQLMGTNDGNGESKHWVDRDKYLQIACPQCYRFQYICDIYDEAMDKNLLSKVEPHTTSLMYMMGKTLYPSYGDQSNIKITTKEDLDIFEGYVLMRLHRQGKLKIDE